MHTHAHAHAHALAIQNNIYFSAEFSRTHISLAIFSLFVFHFARTTLLVLCRTFAYSDYSAHNWEQCAAGSPFARQIRNHKCEIFISRAVSLRLNSNRFFMSLSRISRARVCVCASAAPKCGGQNATPIIMPTTTPTTTTSTATTNSNSAQ